MNCNEIRNEIRARRFRVDPVLARHLEGCELCTSWFEQALLKAALSAPPVPEPSAGFVDRAIAVAVERAAAARPRPARRLAGVAAAILVACAALVAWFAAPQRLDQTVAADAAGERLVRVVIDAKHDRHDALLSVRLAGDLELEGFGDRHLIEWRTDVAKGRNLLSLPVRLKTGVGGHIHVALSYDGKTHAQMSIPVKA